MQCQARKSSKITAAEWKFVGDHGYVIRPRWIGPVERTEYRVYLMGQGKMLAIRKSERAAFNAVVRLVAESKKGGTGKNFTTVAAILDNGAGKRGGTCDDCGASLRYEYHTADGGRYGSCCIAAHVHRPDWMTLRAKQDAERFAATRRGIERMYPLAIAAGTFLYSVYRDNSIGIPGIGRPGERGAKELIERLKAEGWTEEPAGLFGESAYFGNRQSRYRLTAPRAESDKEQ